MAAAGTLTKPTSAQSNYSSFQTYYSPPSPTTSQGSYKRPTSAAGNYAVDAYATYRKPVLTRPAAQRHGTSSQFLPTTSATTPTRIYGTRIRSQSSEDLYTPSTPVTSLQRTHTAPDLRPLHGSLRHHNPSKNEHGPYTEDNHPAVLNARSPADHTRPRAEHSDRSRKNSPAQPIQEMSINANENNTFNLASAGGGQNLDIAPANVPLVSRRQPILNPQNLQVHDPRLIPPNVVDDDVNLKSDPSQSTSNPQTVVSAVDDTTVIARSNSAASHAKGIVNDRANPVLCRQAHETTPSISESAAPRAPIHINHPALAETRPRSSTPVPLNYVSADKSRSLKDRLRRALSFSSATKFADVTQSDTRQDSGSAVQAPRVEQGAFITNSKSTDNLSIASTASSASMMLRKMGHGLSKKTKRSFNGLFSGSTRNGDQRRPSNHVESVQPVTGSITYVNAEPDRSSIQSPGSLITPGHSRAQSSISSIHDRPASSSMAEITEAASNVDGHGSIAFPRLSEELIVEEDRNRRASMHLERPLPIDSAEPLQQTSNTSIVGRRRVVTPTSMTGPSQSSTYTGKGILKRSKETASTPSSDATKEQTVTPDFEISFAPAPSFQLEPLGRAWPAEPAASSISGLKFSPRVTIHDTYTAFEYDRRGEIATCNRLTPLLAQRIKEELNAYKMDEMDVAEDSKEYTHFFS